MRQRNRHNVLRTALGVTWLRAAVLAVCALGLLGCGPVYRTTYDYSPPKTAQGMACILQCDTIYDQCLALELQSQKACLLRSEVEFQHCEKEAHREYRRCKKDGGTNCREDTCSRSYCGERDYDCVAEYNHCYKVGCGGQVRSTTRCVAHCKKKES